MATFVERYHAAYGEEPTSLDALAFDAVRAARVALDHEDGSVTRSALAAQLLHVGETGLTGELAFTTAGERGGLPPLYVVDGDTVRALNRGRFQLFDFLTKPLEELPRENPQSFLQKNSRS